MSKDIFIKYMNNFYSKAELTEFLAWLNSGDSEEILMEFFKPEWQALFENPDESEFEGSEMILDKIHHEINICNNQNNDFISEDENMKSSTCSNTNNDELLCQILDLMKWYTPIKYKILRREKSDDGTLSKQQIVILENL